MIPRNSQHTPAGLTSVAAAGMLAAQGSESEAEMTAGAPLPEAVGLHNELVRVDREDLPSIRRIYWRLHHLARSKRDFTTRLALMFSCVRAGEGGEARRLADDLYGAHRGESLETLGTFAALLSDIGQFERGRAIVEDLVGVHGLRALPALQHSASVMAIFLGDVGWMREMAEIEAATTGHSDTAVTLEVLGRYQLLEHFPAHQAIVCGVIRDVVCECGTGLYLSEHEEPQVQTMVRVPQPRAQRALLQARLRDALDEYYASKGFRPSAYLGRIVTRIAPHPCTLASGDVAAA